MFRNSLLLLSLFILKHTTISAQELSGNAPVIAQCIIGTLIDSTSGKPIPMASLEFNFVSSGLKPAKALTDTSGHFKFCYTSSIKSLKIAPTEFQERTILIPVSEDSIINLQTIGIYKKVTTLLGTSVTIKKDPEPITIEKKTYSVSQNILATGGTAIDALRQIPAVNVDNDGTISLRGSANITIYINGKQSSLSGADRQALLLQIPAANIENIEVNTNPGAKLDAEGQSGIINITLKHQTSKNKNGYITLGAGTHNKYNGTANFNTNYKKFNFGNTLSFRQNDVWGRGYNRRDNHSDIVNNSLDQYNNSDNLTYNYAFSGNIDYNASKTLFISTNYLLSYNKGIIADSNRAESSDMNDSLYQILTRNNAQDNNTRNIDAGITLRKVFNKPSHNLITIVNYSTTSIDNQTDFIQNELNTITESIKTPNPYLISQKNINQFSMPLIQIDYTNPITSAIKLETGLKYTGRDIDNNNIIDSFNYQTQTNDPDYGKSNHFIYNEKVSAAYAMITHTVNPLIKYNAGIRYENTDIAGNQLSTNETFSYNYHNWFPSGNLNFILQKKYHLPDIQVSYSRRINRPDQNALNPFVSFSDPYTLFKGNPYLKPELTNSFELSGLYNSKNITYTATLYGRQTDQPISRYSTIDSNGVATVTRVNLGYNRSVGGEVIVRFSPLKDMKVTLNANLYKYTVAGNVQGNDFVNDRLTYSGKINLSYQFLKKTELQSSFNYMGPMVTAQGEMKPMYGMELGLKKDFLKDKLSVSLNLADVFNNRRFAIDVSDPSFNSSIYRKKESRILTLNLTWKFGSTDAKAAERKPKQQERSSDMDF